MKSLENYLFQSYKKGKRLRKKPSESVSDKDVMSAILLLNGPVCTLQALNNNGLKDSCHLIKAQHFKTVALMLQEANLGTITKLSYGGRRDATYPVMVFIKKPPLEMQQCCEQLKEFCSIEKYTWNYYKRPPTSILQKWRKKLIDLGLVPEYHLRLT